MSRAEPRGLQDPNLARENWFWMLWEYTAAGGAVCAFRTRGSWGALVRDPRLGAPEPAVAPPCLPRGQGGGSVFTKDE